MAQSARLEKGRIKKHLRNGNDKKVGRPIDIVKVNFAGLQEEIGTAVL
jgi:hypothetical protein